MEKWLCLYEKHNKYDADILFKTLEKASKGYGLNISKPERKEMHDRSNHPDDWTRTVDDYMNYNNY